jgi:hypothetical protein
MQRKLFCIIILTAVADLASAQSESATITGTITDPSGALQTSAQVTALQEQTGARTP